MLVEPQMTPHDMEMRERLVRMETRLEQFGAHVDETRDAVIALRSEVAQLQLTEAKRKEQLRLAGIGASILAALAASAIALAQWVFEQVWK